MYQKFRGFRKYGIEQCTSSKASVCLDIDNWQLRSATVISVMRECERVSERVRKREREYRNFYYSIRDIIVRNKKNRSLEE